MTAPITSHPFEPCEHDYSDIVGLCDVWVSTTKRCGQPESAHAAPEPAPDLDRAVIHHMTLMLEEYGRHDPACVCSGDQVVHSADCKDCVCGLLSAMEFGIEHGGPIEPEPMTAEEEAHLNEIAKQAVEKVLSEARVSAGPAPKDRLGAAAEKVIDRWERVEREVMREGPRFTLAREIRAALEAVVRDCAKQADKYVDADILKHPAWRQHQSEGAAVARDAILRHWGLEEKP